MWRPLIHPIFLVAVVAYLMVRINRQGWINLPTLLNDYLADLVCMPIILCFCLVGVRWIKKIPQFWLSWRMILSMTLFYAIIFEWLLPLKSNEYTGDILDVVMYFVGALVYGWFMQPFIRQSTKMP